VTTWSLHDFVDRSRNDVLSARSPVVGTDHVFVATGREAEGSEQVGRLFAFPREADASEPAWVERVRGGASAAPAVVGDLVVVPTFDGRLVGRETATGDRRWERKLGAAPGTPTVAAGRLYVGDRDGTIRALRPDGSTCWSVDRGPLVEGIGLGRSPRASHKPAVAAESVHAVYLREDATPDRGYLVAHDRADGSARWEYAFEAECRPVRAPAVAGGTVYLPGGNALHAVDAATGERRWRYAFGSGEGVSTPAVRDGTVYACAKNVHALDAADGTDRWRFVNEYVRNPRTRRKPLYAAPLAGDGVVYAGLGALDAATGEPRWGEFGNDPDSKLFGTAVGGNLASQGPALVDGALYATVRYGLLVRFGGGE
jgi:outer membrane protein assembly factor BamB